MFFFKKSECGRTMVETISVLAVMGVLSVTSVAGYKWGIERYRTNNLMYEVQHRAASVASAMGLGATPTLAEYGGRGSDFVDGVTFSIGKVGSFSTPPGPNDSQFAIVMDGVPKKYCEKIFNIVGSGGKNQVIRSLQARERYPMRSVSECLEPTRMAVVYNRDLSTKVMLDTINNSDECDANGGYWCEDSGNGVSLCMNNDSACCTNVNCEYGETCRKGACVPCVESELDNGQIICVADGDTYDCVGGYGTPYCVQCTAEQGPAHCSGYSDSDSYRDYEHTPCVCGDNYGCSSHSCVSCPSDQIPVCANVVEWTTPGGGCACAYSDEDAQCADYSQCTFCGPGETSFCGGNECICVKEGETADCVDYFESCGCGGSATGSCIACPVGQKAICPSYADNCMYCYSSFSGGCQCVPEDAETACVGSYYGHGDACISCPAGKKASCYSEGGYYSEPSSKCVCLEEDEQIICTGEYGDLCKKCKTNQELKCPQYGYNSDDCLCVDIGATNVECTTGGDSCVCWSTNGQCISCDENETAYCTQAEETCCDDRYTGDCICVPNDKTGYCSQKKCIFCDGNETPACNDDGSICICLPPGKEISCNESTCMPCDPGRMLNCSDGVCSCGNMACNNSGDCIECPDDETPICAKYGSCHCVNSSQQFECNDYDCTVCATSQTIKIPSMSGSGVCLGANESGDCSSTECIKCSEPKTADCSYMGSCQCLDSTVGQVCTVDENCTGLCEVCTGGVCTTDCANCVGEIEQEWVQPKLTGNSSYGSLSTTPSTGSSASCTSSSHPVWCAFDDKIGSISSKWFVVTSTRQAEIIWQLPVRLKVASIRFYTTEETGYLGRFPDTIDIYGSNDGSSWTKIGSASGYSKPSSSQSLTVSCDSGNVYSNLKFGFTNSRDDMAISEIKITAYQITTTTYREDPITHKCVKN